MTESTMSRYTEEDSYFDDDTESDFLLQGTSSPDGLAAHSLSYPLQSSGPSIHIADTPATTDCPLFDSIVQVSNSAAGPGLIAIPFIFQQAVTKSPM